MEQCKNCKHYDGKRCHRFPAEQLKSPDGYCGEYDKRSEKKDKGE